MRRLAFGSRGWRRYLGSVRQGAVRPPQLVRRVAAVLDAVRRHGDAALVRFTRRFDGVQLTADRIRVPAAEVRACAERADPALRTALGAMAGRIEAFHRRQLAPGFRIRGRDGSLQEEVVTPIGSVGLYVPGGAGAYPSSVLMNAIPARVAGVPRIAVVTPPRALEANPAIAAALVAAGLERCVYRVGGAQAVAALAFGTASVPRVAKVLGPGNAYVVEAKRQVRGTVEVDGECGPSELVILADASADARHVAADLLAQAEHGSGDEIVVLITPSAALAARVARLMSPGPGRVANPGATRRALRRHGAIVRVDSLAQGLAALNLLAPEHAQLVTRRAGALAARAVAGAVFVGPHSPSVVGDYGVGPNHVLPTGGTAAARSPLSVRDFQRRSSRVRLTARGLRRIADDVVRVARAEGFFGHAASVLARLQ